MQGPRALATSVAGGLSRQPLPVPLLQQNVQQMAAQQALQQSLAAMHGGYGYAYGKCALLAPV